MIHLFTHDSIGLGEDGPTHQPVEQLASLRAIPGLDVIRPADANEVAEAWRVALDRTHQPVALVLTRQNVPGPRPLDATPRPRGCGAAATCSPTPTAATRSVILIATGSEVALALAAHEELSGEGIALAGRQPALLGALRPPGRGLPRRGAAAGGHRPGLDRGGLDAGLGPLRRPRRASDDRHAHLRQLGAARRTSQSKFGFTPTSQRSARGAPRANGN